MLVKMQLICQEMAGWNIEAIIEIGKEKNQDKHMWNLVILGQVPDVFSSVYASIPGDVGRSVEQLLINYGLFISWVLCILKYSASNIQNYFVSFV